MLLYPVKFCHKFTFFIKRQLLTQIYALVSVKLSGLEMCSCKKMTNIRYDCNVFEIVSPPTFYYRATLWDPTTMGLPCSESRWVSHISQPPQPQLCRRCKILSSSLSKSSYACIYDQHCQTSQWVRCGSRGEGLAPNEGWACTEQEDMFVKHLLFELEVWEPSGPQHLADGPSDWPWALCVCVDFVMLVHVLVFLNFFESYSCRLADIWSIHVNIYFS